MRNTKRHGTSWMSFIGIALCAAPLTAAPVIPPVDPATAVLAERFAQLSKSSLNSSISLAAVRQAQVFLEAAVRTNPGEPRFHRLRIEAALQLGDRAAAIEAIKAYLVVQPDDIVVKTKLVELHLIAMQSADSRLKYLNQVIAAEDQPAEVRSHAAYLLAVLQEDRLREKAVDEALDTSLRLNPLHAQAWNMYYARVRGQGNAANEVKALVGMLRTNPAQPAVMISLASILADSGLSDAARPWFSQAFETAPNVGATLDTSDMVDYAACLIALGRDGDAGLVLDTLQRKDANSAEAAYLRIILSQREGDGGKIAVAMTAASNALTAKLVQYSEALATGATTRPAPAGEAPAVAPVVPDIAGDVAKLKAGVPDVIYSGYVQSLSDLIFYDVYFAGKPNDAQPLIQQLKSLVQDDSVLIPRLEGWGALAGGKPQEAAVGLSAVQDRDLIARLGMIKLAEADPATKEKAAEDAKILLMQNRGGIAGVMLREALKGLVPNVPENPEGVAIRAELAKFPMEWMDILTKPATFYQLRIVPVKVAHVYGEPMLVRVSLINTSAYDIAIGPLGAVRQDLWFDVQVRGMIQQNASGIAFDRMSIAPVLKQKNPEIWQIVRIDDGALQGLLQGRPFISLPLFVSVFTNPVGGVGAGIVPGPGGYRVQATKVMERMATPVGGNFTQVMNGINAPGADDRMRSVELLTMVASALRSKPDATDDDRKTSNLISQAVERATTDVDPNVKAWSKFAAVIGGDSNKRIAAVERLLTSDSWQQRILGLACLQSAPKEMFDLLVPKIAESDPDATVKSLALAMEELRAERPATQPATAPSADSPQGAPAIPPAGNLPGTSGAGLNK